jgi:hypothetical protein
MYGSVGRYIHRGINMLKYRTFDLNSVYPNIGTTFCIVLVGIFHSFFVL